MKTHKTQQNKTYLQLTYRSRHQTPKQTQKQHILVTMSYPMHPLNQRKTQKTPQRPQNNPETKKKAGQQKDKVPQVSEFNIETIAKDQGTNIGTTTTGNLQEKTTRKEITDKLKSTQAKLNFYLQLFREREQVHNQNKQQKIAHYETYLTNLHKLQQTYIKQTSFPQRPSFKEDEYAIIRRRINKQGRQGLNYSKRSLSLLSGCSGDTMLLSLSRTSQKGNVLDSSEEQFSFGTRLKTNKSVEFSL